LELVYLWVEDYKNIHEQGFNFSPKFNCHYDGETLTIDENLDEDGNKQYIENFFGDNINVTAIVGKNGSGKSSVLELLAKLILEEEIEKKVLFVFTHENSILIFSNIDITHIIVINRTSINMVTPYNLEKIIDFNFFSTYYSPNFTNGIFNSILELFSTPSWKTHETSESGTIQGHGYKNSNMKNQSLLNLVLNSTRILDRRPTSSGYRNMHSSTIQEQYNNYEIGKIIFILYFMKILPQYDLPIGIISDDKLEISIQHNRTTSQVNETCLIDKIDKLLTIEEDFIDDDVRAEYSNQINLEAYRKNHLELIQFLKQKVSPELWSGESFSLTKEDAIKFIDFYVNLYRYNRNIESSLFDFKFKFLSSGEENLILMFALLEKGIDSFFDNCLSGKEHTMVLMLDEIENNFHVQWQKELLIQILKFLMIISHKWYRDNKRIKFLILLSSHSPFLLSDIPKQNIIFLDKDEKTGNCIVVDGLNDKKETFGANIHTLLSDSFFMKESLMGEFAKRKIKEIINFHKIVEEENEKKKKKKEYDLTSLEIKYKENKTRFWQTQSIIGEEYLKQVVKNHLRDIENILLGHNQAKKEEIKRLREEATRLEKMQ